MNDSLDRAGIAPLFAEAMKDLQAHPPRAAQKYLLRSTSGTTGSGPLHIVFEMNPESFGRHRRAQRILGCVGLRNVRLSLVLLARYGDTPGQRVLCLDPKDVEDPRLSAVLEDYAADDSYGMLFFFKALGERLSASARASLKRLIVVGEYLTEASRGVLTRAYPNAQLVQGYGCTEAAQMSASPCAHLLPHQYHPLKGIEFAIDAPDAEGVGEVLVSWKVFRNLYARRYRLGDSGRLLSSPCACGEKVTLELRGRSGYDYLKLAGAVLRKDEFDRVAARFSESITAYRAEAYEARQMGRTLGGVVLHVYRAQRPLDAAESSALAAEFSAELFVTPTQTYEDLVGRGAFVPFVVMPAPEPFAGGGKAITLFMRTEK